MREDIRKRKMAASKKPGDGATVELVSGLTPELAKLASGEVEAPLRAGGARSLADGFGITPDSERLEAQRYARQGWGTATETQG